jgi:hypothetical protein
VRFFTLIRRYSKSLAYADGKPYYERFVMAKSVLRNIQKAQAAEAQQPKKSGQLEVVLAADSGTLTYHGDKIETVDQLLDHAKIDRDIWEVAEVKINNWEVAGKRKVAVGETKTEELWKTGLRQIAVKLRRKAPKTIQEGIQGLITKMPKALPRRQIRKTKETQHLVEFSLYDCHLGKLCWSKQTGSDDYDLEIACSDYANAIDRMVQQVAPYSVEEVVIPIGNDFLHFDDFSTKATTKGTVVDSTDDRPTKVFRAGFSVLKQAAEQALDIAPKVSFIWVPGNHDYHASWYLVEMLGHYFSREPRVSVDNSETRKHKLFGKNLIGWDHGEGMSLDKLAHIFPIEAAKHWSESIFRYIRVGHFHKKKEIKHISKDTYEGVRVDVIPSLSATDAWHYRNGYIGSQRAAEVAVWHKETGISASFTIEAQSAIQGRKK